MTVKGRGAQSRAPPCRSGRDEGPGSSHRQARSCGAVGGAGGGDAGAGGHPALQLYLMAVKVQLRE